MALVLSLLVAGACVADGEPGGVIGIGAMLQSTRTDAGLVVEVVRLIPDSPAEKAGVQAGDVITHVDGTATAGKPLQAVVELIRGEAGTDVMLTLTRAGADAPMDITVPRGEVRFDAPAGLADERAEGLARVAAEQGQGAGGRANFTIAVGDGEGRMQVIRSSDWGVRSGPQAAMAVTETHVFVLRGHMLHQFAAEGMELVWDRDLRTADELAAEEKGIVSMRGGVGGTLEIMGPYLYVLRNYMLYQFRLEGMEELAATDLRTDEEKARAERLMQALP